MRTLKLTVAMLLLAGVAFAATSKNIYKVFHFSTREVGIVCTDGADPTGKKVGEILVISCGTADPDSTPFHRK